MMSRVRGSNMIGAMVIAMAEGTRIGKVNDVYLDKENKRLLGISFNPGGWGAEEENFVAFGDILKFGYEMVIVSGQAAAKAHPENIETCALKKLKGCRISTQSGRQLASLDDVVLSRENGRIMELLLPENLKLEIDMNEVIFGPDLIMVPAGYEPAFAQVEIDKGAQWRRALDVSGLAEKFQESIESVKSSEHTEKMIHLWKSGSQKARGTYLKTSEAIQQALNKIKKKRESEKEAHIEPETTVSKSDFGTGSSQGPSVYGEDIAPTSRSQSEKTEKV